MKEIKLHTLGELQVEGLNNLSSKKALLLLTYLLLETPKTQPRIERLYELFWGGEENNENEKEESSDKNKKRDPFANVRTSFTDINNAYKEVSTDKLVWSASGITYLSPSAKITCDLQDLYVLCEDKHVNWQKIQEIYGKGSFIDGIEVRVKRLSNEFFDWRSEKHKEIVNIFWQAMWKAAGAKPQEAEVIIEGACRSIKEESQLPPIESKHFTTLYHYLRSWNSDLIGGILTQIKEFDEEFWGELEQEYQKSISDRIKESLSPGQNSSSTEETYNESLHEDLAPETNLGNADTKDVQEKAQIKIPQKYIEHVEKNYGKLFVLGQANPKPIDEIYTDLNLLNKVTAFKRYAPESLSELFIERKLSHEKQDRRDGIELVNKGDNLFILGKPGAGKTTFLKHVAIKAVRNELNSDTDLKIPIFITLHSHSRSGKKIIESVEEELSSCGFLQGSSFAEDLLHSGCALVLFDGLDEVKEEDELRSDTIHELKSFMKTYSESQFIITCRVAATEYSFENVTYVEMADFNKKQIQIFVNNWFHENQELAESCWEELDDEENYGLREMGRVPLLLGLLCLTYEEVRYFPERRVDVYEEAIDALLKHWDNRKSIKRDQVYGSLVLGRKRQLLNHIAATSFEEGEFIIEKNKLASTIKTYIQSFPEIKEEVDGEVVIGAIAAQNGILVERALRLYSFAHLSFQEYFVAKYIADNFSAHRLKGLLTHVTHDQWREIFLLTASLLDKQVTSEFFEQFLKTIANLPIQDEGVAKILTWINRKAELAYQKAKKYKRNSLRFRYLEIALEVALDNGRDPDITCALDFAFERALVHTHNRELDLNLDLNLDNAIKLARCLFIDFLSDPDPDYSFVRQATKNAGNLGYNFIKEELEKLLKIEPEHETFMLQVESIYKEFLSISGLKIIYNFNDSDKEFLTSIKEISKTRDNLNKYIKANRLLVNCLSLASMSDRQGILDRLALFVIENPTEQN